MLQIRLSKVPQAEGGAGTVKPLQAETVTVACPDHLILADLPVANGIGAATAASIVKSVGRRSRRHLGERVHFCVRCDFPIAVYGRLVFSPLYFCVFLLSVALSPFGPWKSFIYKRQFKINFFFCQIDMHYFIHICNVLPSCPLVCRLVSFLFKYL